MMKMMKLHPKIEILQNKFQGKGELDLEKADIKPPFPHPISTIFLFSVLNVTSLISFISR